MLYNARSAINGAPTTSTGTSSWLALDQLTQAGQDTVIQSLLVEQVLVGVGRDPELGKREQSAAPASEACWASAIVRWTLNAGSATLTVGTAAATRTKPWRYREWKVGMVIAAQSYFVPMLA